MAARARRVRANPPETRARGAMTETKPRDGTTGTVVSNMRSSRATVSHCSKSGHKRADCRTRLPQQKNGAVAGAQEPESEAEDVKAAQWSDADSDGADLNSSSWCFAALNNPRGPAGTLVVDSGADDHICHPDFAKEFPH